MSDELGQYAEAIRDLRISHEAGHAVLAEHLGYDLCNLSLEAVASADGAIGGSAEINFRLRPNRPDFAERLQDFATVLMGGVAAEELTHPHLANSTHAKQDVSDFKIFAAKWKTDAEADAILAEGHVRSKELLSTTELTEQHRRMCDFLAANPQPKQPNGKFLRRVMKGLST